MTYSAMAQVFEAARAEGASTEDALRAVDAKRFSTRKLSASARAELIRRRKARESLKTLAAEFGISKSYASALTAGCNVRAPRTRPPIPTVAHRIVSAVAEQLHLPITEIIRDAGKATHFVPRMARRAAVRAMRSAGLSWSQTARALGREDHTVAIYLFRAGADDVHAAKVADDVVAKLGLRRAE